MRPEKPSLHPQRGYPNGPEMGFSVSPLFHSELANDGKTAFIFVSKTVDGLDHHFKFVPQFRQLAQMVTNLSFPAVFLGLAYLFLIGSAVS